MTDITPFKVAIPDAELDLLRKKLELARFPTNISNAQWGEDNKVPLSLLQDTVKYWLAEYDWRREEAVINALPQFTTPIALDPFGTFNIHFVHVRADASATNPPVPLLFLHGWPGSFIEVQKVAGPLAKAGFHVVAPSLPGYGFSSYTDKAGFKYYHQADIFKKLMLRLGYEKFVVQGGDWGSIVARALAQRHPENARLLHVNMAFANPPAEQDRAQYSAEEQANMERTAKFRETESAYSAVHTTKVRTIGVAMHDSPVAMLAWIVDKLYVWTDNYPWTPAELITWTLMHWFPGPTTAMNMYRENFPIFVKPEKDTNKYVTVPTGVSIFPRELVVPPRAWVEKDYNLVAWDKHTKGGHFAAWEQPDELVGDVVRFVGEHWASASGSTKL